MILVNGSNGQQGYRYFHPLRRQAGSGALTAIRMPHLWTMQCLAWLNLAICAVPLLRSWSGLAGRHPTLDGWVCWGALLLLTALLLWQLGGLLPGRRVVLVPPLQIYRAPAWLSGAHVMFWVAASTSFNMLASRHEDAQYLVWETAAWLCLLMALVLLVDGWRMAHHARNDLA